MDNFSELAITAAKFKTSYAKEDDEAIKEVMRILESENKEFKEICKL